MATIDRPASPLNRIAPEEFYYCPDCHCLSCASAHEGAFCPNCNCSACKEPSGMSTRDADYHPNDDSDEDNNKKRKQTKVLEITSPQKRNKTESVTSSIRAVADAASVSASALPIPHNVLRFCLVSLGYRDEDCLQTCHIIPRALDEDNLAKLEFAWGLPYYGLYLHSRYNLITLSAGLHASFDKGCWALVPIDIQYLKALNETFDKNGAWRKKKRDNDRMTKIYKGCKSFKYILFPLTHEEGMRNVLIRRRATNWTEQPSEVNYQHHFFPYPNLPILSSHIRPHFVVFNLVSKLQQFTKGTFAITLGPLFQKHADLLNCIITCQDLYNQWTGQSPPNEFTQRSDGPTGRADPDDSDDRSLSNKRPTRSARPKAPSGKGSGSGVTRGGNTSGTVDNELHPDDSLTAILHAKADIDDANDGDGNDIPDDEHTDDESDEHFYGRLNEWVSNTAYGLPPPPPSPAPAHSLSEPEPMMQCDNGSENGSAATLIGIKDSKIHAETLEMVHVFDVNI